MSVCKLVSYLVSQLVIKCKIRLSKAKEDIDNQREDLGDQKVKTMVT